MSEHPTTLRIPGAANLAIGEARVFPLPDSEEQGFVIGTPEGLRAFRNRCKHWPALLDMDDAEFWNEDVGAIQCKIHGAIFRAKDGLCLAGPCPGAILDSWPVAADGDDAVVDLA